MSIARELSSAGLFVIEDSQAKHKTSDAPDSIRVSYHDIEDMLETVETVASTYPCPIVLILASGQVVVLAKEGKGGIALQGKEGQLTDAQAEAMSIVDAVLRKHFGLEAPKTTKKKTASKTTPDASETPVSDEPASTDTETPTEAETAVESEPVE